MKYLKEFYSHNSTITLSVLWLVGMCACMHAFTTWTFWLFLVLGILLFFINEYTTHRFFFHMDPPKNPKLLKLIKRLHYDHHEFPLDLHLLFLPLWFSLPFLAVIWAIAFGLTRSPIFASGLVLGAILALLYYEWVHYVAHRPIKPLSPWGKWVKKVHLWHHYKNEKYWFGVTSPAMDVVSGTWKDEKQVQLSQTARKLTQ